ncbi:hypothetical protein B0H14DRAFT_3438230 [Mycena olivaceomarginata]|nr:hypothetical protein B0H14DRAFT_3438230 [Mycena olivaceomarginata]
MIGVPTPAAAMWVRMPMNKNVPSAQIDNNFPDNSAGTPFNSETSLASIKNAPVVGLAEGNAQFSNYHLAALVLVIPYIDISFLLLINRGGWYMYWFIFLLTGFPTTIGYWTLMSTYGARKNEKVTLPGKDIEEYIPIKDPA